MTDAARPDPDRLLAEVQRDEARAKRGRLRIFFGASAGVGKTYSMLEAARAAHATGTDIVVGYVEPHGRPETERLLEGLELLPTVPVRYRGMTRREFDLDAALQRHATITLVDELAHSNLIDGDPPPRHPKRWQDIEELLEAGLDVWTTLNVQHLESLNDVIAAITGSRQQETVPDRILEDATEIELIDLPPDDLLERLRAGKVYLPEQVSAALDRFFRKPNLLALRELALRRTADRVDAAAREYAGREPVSRPWLARERFLVGVGPDDQGEELVRFGKRFADALDAEWIVVAVETPPLLRLGEAERNRRIEVLRLAESLGAEAVTLDGPTAAAALLQYARTRNVTRIVVGETKRRGLRALWQRPTVDELLAHVTGIDVSVIARRDRQRVASAPNRPRLEPPVVHWNRYGWAGAVTAACTGLAFLMEPLFSDANLVMVYLLGAAIAGLRLGRGPATLTAVANVVAFNFFFVPPRLTFAVSNAEYLVTFAVMLGVALTIATLMANVRMQTRVAGARERRTALLYAMSRELAGTRGADNMVRVAARHVGESFASQAAVLLPDANGRLQEPATPGGATFAAPDRSIGQWVFDHGRPAGLGTDALPGAPALYLPLAGSERTLGVLAVLPTNQRRVLLPEQRHLLETFAGQIALAIERAQLAETAEAARVSAETESLRNTLLASISHDLRTPLAVITGASTALADPALAIDPDARVSLARTIAARAHDMADLISNVLDLMRFESGHVPLRRQWETLDDLVGLALSRVEPRLGSRCVAVEIPADVPPVFVDAVLFTQVLVNLLENAAKHTPERTAIRISATAGDDEVVLVVEDNGPGLPGNDPEQLFAKFQRGRSEGDVPGAGLGLAICRAVIQAHGGRISAGNREGGGARFVVTLPSSDQPHD
ncbi:MAG: sensor histidine kinase KdpD [Steroidobacteraceae bacterium]|nr:sensor histidine kinase KdpD [Steroidobacteraceae bacterium]